MICLKKKSKSIATITILLEILMFTCFTTACQPTPDKPVIVNRNKLEEKLYSDPAPPVKYEAPAHWSETVETEKVRIVIDTDIKLPDVSAYPVVKLEPATFTQQRVNELVDYFAAGKKLHLPRVMTKADYELLIIEAKKGHEVDGEYVFDEQSQEWVEELQRLQAAAPDDSPVIYTDSMLTYLRDFETGKEIVETGKNYLDVVVENGDGQIFVSNYVDNAGSLPLKYINSTDFAYFANVYWYLTESLYRQFTADGTPEEQTGWDGAGELFNTMTLNRDEAESLARKTVSDLGITDLVLVSTERAVSPHAEYKTAYNFLFARQSSGIAVYKIKNKGWAQDEQPAEYAPPFTEETLTIVVTEDGLDSFNWSGYARVIETLNENVKMLPFEEIQQALKNQIFYEESFHNGYGMSDYEVSVHSAELRMGYIGVKDSLSQAFLVSVWVFETSSSYYNGTMQMRRSSNDGSFVINAIDGGVIQERREWD